MNNNLPVTEYRFEIDVKGEDTGVEYKGGFKYHRLTIGEKIKLQQWMAEKSGENTVDSIKSLYITLAIIRSGCDECPGWFKDSDYGINLYDFNVINEIFEKKAAKEGEWAEKIKKEAEKVVIKDNEK